MNLLVLLLYSERDRFGLFLNPPAAAGDQLVSGGSNINSQSLEDAQVKLAKLQVGKVLAQLTNPRDQLSHQIGFPS